MQIHPLVGTTEHLARLAETVAQADFITVDTEFMRESTYWPELCLVQVASPTDAFAIDPLAPGLDLAPFLDLLAKPDLLKVIHAGGQDIEIFLQLTGRVPQPLFDTQVAAMALGMGEQVGYAGLVAHFTGQQVDKGARFTDWARRPLSDRQLAYAIADVTHLAALFPKMLAKLRKTGRGEWLDDEMARVTEPGNYIVDPESAWQRLKLPSRKPEVLGRLKALARWRELEARDKNVPRGRIVKDETLADLAAGPPATQADLAKVRGLSPAWASNAIGVRLMQVLTEAPPLPATDLPPKDGGRPGLSTDANLVADLLKLLLKIRAKEKGVAPRLIARGEELDAIAGGARSGLAMLEGWRHDLFGRDALALVEGRLGFSVEGGALRMRTLEPPTLVTQPGVLPPPRDRSSASAAPAPSPGPAPDAAVPPTRRRAAPRRAPG
jgi:ribonuclease D